MSDIFLVYFVTFQCAVLGQGGTWLYRFSSIVFIYVMVVLEHKCVQQIHLLALYLETLGYILRLLNALNGFVYFLIIGDPRGDNLMMGSLFQKLLTELFGRAINCNVTGGLCARCHHK